jgi:hypothetical protein
MGTPTKGGENNFSDQQYEAFQTIVHRSSLLCLWAVLAGQAARRLSVVAQAGFTDEHPAASKRKI